VDVKTEDILWKGAFDFKFDRLLSVQDNVAQQIIQGLEVSLSPSEAERIKPEQPINPQAYEYFLRGVDLYARGDFPLAVKMLEKASDLGPEYAPTWAYLGQAYNANASFQLGGREQHDKAQAAFERALKLQPSQIEARIYMANMFTDTGHVEQAVPLLREALKTNPNHAEVHWELGYAYRFAGMLQQSVAECERARQLDPGVKRNTSALNTYLYLGEYDKFLRSLPAVDDSAFVAFYRGFGAYYEKQWDHALADFDRAYTLDPSLLQVKIGRALGGGLRHQNTDGLKILHDIENKIEERNVGDPEALYKIAQAYAALGDKPSGMRVLQHSIERGFFPYPYFSSDPLIDVLRGETDFASLMDRARGRYEDFRKKFFQ
jgi:tetratricopeptide (TPR) repeat protein